MDLSNLKPAEGSVKNKKRIGRGQGSGRGGTATKGHKGAQSRSGNVKKHFEFLVKTGKFVGDISFSTKSGNLRYWTVNSVKLSETRFLVYVTDITEKRLTSLN